MKTDGKRLWMDVTDFLVPYLRLDATQQALYFHLLRLSRLEGIAEITISVNRLSRAVGLARWTVCTQLRNLGDKGCLGIREIGMKGYRMEVFAPAEIPGCVTIAEKGKGKMENGEDSGLPAADCFRNARLRRAVIQRERGRCFYCLRNISGDEAELDHVTPRSRGGDNTYRNVVACCRSCNSQKADRSAEEFLRELYRSKRLSAYELEQRRKMVKGIGVGPSR